MTFYQLWSWLLSAAAAPTCSLVRWLLWSVSKCYQQWTKDIISLDTSCISSESWSWLNQFGYFWFKNNYCQCNLVNGRSFPRQEWCLIITHCKLPTMWQAEGMRSVGYIRTHKSNNSLSQWHLHKEGQVAMLISSRQTIVWWDYIHTFVANSFIKL
jgi:hypothetical protein